MGLSELEIIRQYIIDNRDDILSSVSNTEEGQSAVSLQKLSLSEDGKIRCQLLAFSSGNIAIYSKYGNYQILKDSSQFTDL